jgi:membrane fusion protein, multidrug efflux system
MAAAPREPARKSPMYPVETRDRDDLPEPARRHTLVPARRRRWPGLVIGLTALATVLAAGLIPRLDRSRALDARAVELAGPPRVAVSPVRKGQPRSELVLPATALPAQSTVIHARLDGFVHELHADLGDSVREGRLLALLQAPELEADLARARARFGELERNLELARTSADRHAKLAESGISSLEVADEARARANSAEAAQDGSRAEASRLEALYAYRRVVAPFDGVITKRSVDRGALVKAASTALFEIAQTRTLKVFVDVPQTLAPDVQPGMVARVFAPEAPDRIVEGKVVRTARALDPATRTLRTEIHLPGGGPLLSGAFVRVRLQVQRTSAPLLIPAVALVTRKEGPRAMVVGPDGRVEQRPLILGRDMGANIEVLSGLQDGERVVLSPPDELADGATVQPAEPVATPPPAK